MNRRIFVFIILLASLAVAQPEAKTDELAVLKFLEGKWIDEKPGVSKVVQDYEFIMNGKYLSMKTRAVFEPSEKNPKSEVHEDFGIFSYDQSRKTLVFRQFHIEGFVIYYALEKKDQNEKELTFVSEQIENAPPGTKTKEIFKFVGEDKVEQSFHVAWPNREFACYSLNNLTRIK